MRRRIVSLLTAFLLMATSIWSAQAMPDRLVPGGSTIGLKLYSDGLVVTGFEKPSPARAAGLKTGDVIIRADGKKVHTAQALRSRIGTEQMVLTVLRKGREAEFSVLPQEPMYSNASLISSKSLK